jgi:hypothetical protein
MDESNLLSFIRIGRGFAACPVAEALTQRMGVVVLRCVNEGLVEKQSKIIQII